MGDYIRGFGLDLLHFIHSQFRTTCNTALALIYTLYIEFTVAHTLGFSVLRGNVFTEPLPSNGYTHHNINISVFLRQSVGTNDAVELSASVFNIAD
jgi:hypothetical protein